MHDNYDAEIISMEVDKPSGRARYRCKMRVYADEEVNTYVLPYGPAHNLKALKKYIAAITKIRPERINIKSAVLRYFT